MTKAGFLPAMSFISAHQTRQATAGIHHQRSKRLAFIIGDLERNAGYAQGGDHFPCVLNTGTAMQRTPRESSSLS